MNSIKLRDGNSMPQLGFGMWQVPDDVATASVLEAFKAGYRSIDSAQIYENESGLGRAIKESGLPRNEMFITTKIWNAEQGFDTTMKSFEVSMKKLGLDTLDLLLIHWPSPHRNLYVETWKALIELQKSRRVTSIGVSNFRIEDLEKIINETSVVPAINQIELHPRFQQKELREFHKKHNIQTESWSPLGQGQLINDEIISKIAKKHKKSNAQVILRWHIQNDLIAIPKSVTPERISQNFQIFDFKLDADDMSEISRMDSKDGRIGPDPGTATF